MSSGTCISPGRPRIGYDLLAEMLMTIPYAEAAPLGRLAHDFGASRSEALADLRRLELRFGVRVVQTDKRGNLTVRIQPQDRDAVETAACTYWQDVYGRANPPGAAQRSDEPSEAECSSELEVSHA